MNIRLSFVIASSGRNSLSRMIDSLTKQIDFDDEILVICDAEAIKKHATLFLKARVFPFECPKGHNWGHDERNFGMRHATGTHIVFGDDDDAFLPGAVKIIKDELNNESYAGPVMFRMINENGAILWKVPAIEQGNHGTPQFVVPNVPELLGRFGNRYEGDFDFVISTMKKYPPGKQLLWSTEIIYGCRHFGNLPLIPKT